jgi:hypothetical protein
MNNCEHNYQYLGQKTTEYDEYGSLTRYTNDVFYCTKCLDYNQKCVKRETKDFYDNWIES